MTKVCFLKSRLHGGGLEKATLHLIQAFLQAGCEVTILTSEGETSSFPTVEVSKRSKITLIHLLRFDKACQEWLKHNPQDIVFGTERTTFQTHYRAGNGVHQVYLKQRALVDSPLKCLSFALNPLHRTLLHVEKKAFEDPRLKVLFTNSEMVKREVCENYSVDPQKVEVVHNGVEWQEWSEPFEESDFHRNGPFEFLFIGNGYRRKGLSFLLKGLKGLPKKDYHLTVVGKDREEAYFKAMAKDLNVSFQGAVKNPVPFYQKADALVLPSIYDPFANVTLEALAMGLYVVTSPFNGGKEVLTKESGTIISNLSDQQTVVEALTKALERPKTLDRALLTRDSVKEYDFSKQLDKIVRKTMGGLYNFLP